jgi:hypothetical protein
MSRHHITLPPIIYTPVPKPKPARTRPRVGRLFRRSSSAGSSVAGSDEREDSELSARPAPFAGQSAVGDAPAFGLLDGRRRSGGGRLSETTLKVMLQAQESPKPDRG